MEVKTCPFCGEGLMWDEMLRCYKHPINDCIFHTHDSECGQAFIYPSEIDRWNRRFTDE